jgi:hypothetical protein
VHLNARGAAALTALPIAAQLLQARWLACGEPVVSEARVALAAALYGLRLGAPTLRRTDAESSASEGDEEEEEEEDGSGIDGRAHVASSLEARAAETWRRLCVGEHSALSALPAPEASALALRLAQQTRAHAALAPRWRDRQEAAASAAALTEALTALCATEGGVQHASLDALLAPAGAWPAWVVPPSDVAAAAAAADACEPYPADWARRMAQLASALALEMPSGALFAGSADTAVPPRRVWLAAELLCAGETRAVHAALQGGEAAQQQRLALALLHALLTVATASSPAASAAAEASLAAMRVTLRLLARSDAWDGAAALSFFGVALTGPAAAEGTAAGAALAEAAAPPLLAVLRSPKGGAAGAVAAEQHTLARTRAACAALRTRGSPPGAASVALRCAAACFPGAGNEKEEEAPAPAPMGARAGVTDAEVDALCELWECVAAADATAAAAAAAARRFGGAEAAGADVDAPLSSADEGVASVALPLLRCAWHRLSRSDWALLAGRMRRWLTAGATMPPLLVVPPAAQPFEAAALAGLPAAACALLAAVDALPVAVAEPAAGASAAGVRASSGDVVPFSAAGAPALVAARAMAEVGWPVERDVLLQAALGALFGAGALCLCDAAGARHALRADSGAAPFWRALGALCEKAPPGATRAAADAADARGGGGAIACLYALLRLGSGADDDADSDGAAEQARAGASPLACAQRAAYALLCGPALRTAGVLGLDAAVADVDEVLALADKAAAERAERADSGEAEASPADALSSTILAVAEAACLREPLAALLAAPGSPHGAAARRAWALLLSALLAAPRGGSAAKRIAAYVRDAGRLPQLLSACTDALPLPPPKALRSGGGGAAASAAAAALVPAAVSAAWRAAAEPAAALASAASLPPACLAGALFGACLRGLPAESRAWFGELRDARRAAALEACVAAWVSPALVAAELDAAAAAPPSVSGLTVRAARGSREVTAAYSVDDALLEVTVRLPGAYPLRAPEAECARRVGVSEARLRKWLLAMAAALRGGGGGVAGALALWGASVEREFAGVEPCPICYMTLHAGSHALPRLACRQCRNRFHAACLYAWFTSSNKSACPICQTPWGTTVS